MNEQTHLSILLANKQSEQISQLQEILDGSGINASEALNDGQWQLNFDWDEQAIKRIRTRGAGRKPLLLNGSPTVLEVLEMQKQNGVAKTCQILNISPSTFYRRKKVVKSKYDPDEFSTIPFVSSLYLTGLNPPVTVVR
ncbi:hypothetical protein, partial [Ileibacterium valens]